MAIDIITLPEVAQRIVAEIKQHRKVFAIFLFGSWARGKQMPISDIKCRKYWLSQRGR